MTGLAMLPVPDPLHPAVVHFPVVLLLLGAPLAVLAVFLPRLAWPVAVVLLLGAAGAVAAVQTGQLEKRDEIAVPAGEGRAVLKDHEKMGETARNMALAAAVLASAAAVSRCCGTRGVALWLAGGTAAAALLAAWEVVQAGHTGGLLVYHHGVGLRF
ncbi:MAG: DUF2231 domain-containing protein [Chthoniobacterales bacterium]|jgi:uncharacterized membrane protein